MKFKKEMSSEDFKNELLSVETAEEQAGVIENYMHNNMLNIEEQVKAEYEELKLVTDNNVLANRGIYTLTAEETKFYNEVKKSGTIPADKLLPETIIEKVLDDLVKDRPLLKLIRFIPGSGREKIIVSKRLGKAVWGPLHRDLEGQLDAVFDVTETTLHNLTAFFLISNDTLDLGPRWIDRFVRLCLQEAIAEAWEEAIVKGTGNNEPIGLLKDLQGAVTDGEYPDKKASGTLTFGADNIVKELTGMMGDLSEYEVKVDEETFTKTRDVNGRVNFIINPSDYYAVVNATTVRNANGVYVTNMPFVSIDKVVQSEFVPKGKLIAFVDDGYFAQTSYSNRLRVYEETFAMKRATLIAMDVFGWGKPVDNSSALVYDLNLTALEG